MPRFGRTSEGVPARRAFAAVLAVALVAGFESGTAAPTNTPEAIADRFISALAARNCSAALEVSVVDFWLAETGPEARTNCVIVMPTLPEITSYEGHGAMSGAETPGAPDSIVLFEVTTTSGPAVWLVSLALTPDGWLVIGLTGPERPEGSN